MATTLFPSILPSDDADAQGESETDAALSVEDQLQDGVCPWCPSDEDNQYDNVGSHAAQAHPDEYDEVR